MGSFGIQALGAFLRPWAKHISCLVPLLFKSDLLQFVSEQLIDIGLGFLL